MVTQVNDRRYVTWRLPDRQFSKVHVQQDPEMTVCGKTLPRATGSPQPPIPPVSMCPECAASERLPQPFAADGLFIHVRPLRAAALR